MDLVTQLVFTSQSPEVFGPKHLIGSSFILAIIALLLILLLKVLKVKNHRRVLQITAVFLLSLEIIKYAQALITSGSFPLNYIPMQLCSFSLYLMPLVAFGNEKVSKFFMPMAYSIGILAGFIVLIYPATVLGGPYNWLPLSANIVPMISFFYHGTMIFFAFYLVLSKTYQPSFVDYGKVFLSLIIFAGLASVTNLIFDTDMMFLNTASGNPFQFVLIEYGRIPYMIVMIGLAAFLLCLPVLPYLSTIKDVFSSKMGTSKISSSN